GTPRRPARNDHVTAGLPWPSGSILRPPISSPLGLNCGKASWPGATTKRSRSAVSYLPGYAIRLAMSRAWAARPSGCGCGYHLGSRAGTGTWMRWQIVAARYAGCGPGQPGPFRAVRLLLRPGREEACGKGPGVAPGRLCGFAYTPMAIALCRRTVTCGR